PPLGVDPDFEHPDSRGNRITATSVVCWVVATLFVSLRLYSRRTIVHIIGLEDCNDCNCLCVWLSSSVLRCRLKTLGATHGAGIHFWDLRITMLDLFARLDITESAFYGACTFCIKLSILSFLSRLSPDRRFRALIILMSVFITVYCLFSVFQFFFSWSAVPKTRHLRISAGSCSGPLQVCAVIAGINAATDIVIYLIPIAIVWNLQLTGRKKLGVIINFTLGSLVCIASVARFVVQIVRFHDPDYSRIKEIFLPLNTLEINVGIICACLPHLAPLARRLTSRSLTRAPEDRSINLGIPHASTAGRESFSLSTPTEDRG
ncbi:uncharacterized protein K444DRAFT_530712, partial [Hyaloscypha bicolor E]